MWADLGALKMTGAEQLITLWEFYQGREHYNYNKESIAIIKPLENKRGKESSGHCCYLSLCLAKPYQTNKQELITSFIEVRKQDP